MGGGEGGTSNPSRLPPVSILFMQLSLLANHPFRRLTFANGYLRPIADAIAVRLQAAVSICVIGPIAERGGEIEVRRYAL